MNLRFRILGILIIACGAAVCYGAAQIWPAAALRTGLTVWDALRAIGAVAVALVGIGNVAAGFAVLVLKAARST